MYVIHYVRDLARIDLSYSTQWGCAVNAVGMIFSNQPPVVDHDTNTWNYMEQPDMFIYQFMASILVDRDLGK